jgi:hypothetical protein
VATLFTWAASARVVLGMRMEVARMAVVPDPKLNAEVGPHFMGIPERWLDSPTWRCSNGHVSKYYLRSESYGDRCLECRAGVRLTYPEDKEAGEP